MQDVQSSRADVALPIDRVGVRGIKIPLTVRDRDRDVQHTVARVDLSVDLPAEFKGTHMSRFLECLRDMPKGLDLVGCKHLLQEMQVRLKARWAHLCFEFPYFMERCAPASANPALMDYQCFLRGHMDGDRLDMVLGVEVPVMTVCPCSLAISDQGAHSQRALVRIEARSTKLVWLEDLIEIGERAGSSPVYALLKREDEKFVTEAAFDNPCFVEDVVRNAARELVEHPRVQGFRVEVESQESIHNHSAYAVIEDWGETV